MDNPTPTITVIGSFMMDLVIKAARRPQRGETLVGESFGMFPGGKGFNQAVAAARLGARVNMVGKLGRDDFGGRFLDALHREGIHSSCVFFEDNAHTGVGSPVIDAQGDNSIIIIPGANMALKAAEIERAADLIAASDLVMMQLEVPVEADLRAAQIASAAGVPVLLNPAPARPLPAELLKLVTILTPNETEATLLSGQSVEDDRSAAGAAQALQDMGVDQVVLTLGARGALARSGKETVRVPGYSVQVVDTTAAGDAFCAGLAVSLARGAALEDALRFANATGALACTVLGAEPAMPNLQKVAAFLKAMPEPQPFAVG